MTTRMKVLHVGKFYPPHRGGMESTLETLSTGLAREVEVEVLVANENAERRTEILDGVKVTRVGRLLDMAGTPMCKGLVKAIRESDADVVHVHWPNPAAVVAYLASGRRGPLVLTWHSDVVRQATLEKIFRPILDHFLWQCNGIIVTSPNYLESSPILGIHRNRCRVIPFGIDSSAFSQRKSAEIARIRRRFGNRIVLTVGRHVYYKGFQYLIRAMREIDAHLVVVGTGPLQRTLEEEAHILRVESRVSFLDQVDDLSPYYHACDLFVLPSVSRAEAFGIVQLEAMACGKPVVNTELDSGVPFVSRHFETGITVPPCDSGLLAHAINFLLERPHLRARFGRAAYERVRRDFDVSRMLTDTLEFYEQVAGGADAALTAVRARLRLHAVGLPSGSQRDQQSA